MVSKLTKTFEWFYWKLCQTGIAPNIYFCTFALVIISKIFLNNIDSRTILIINSFQYEMRGDF